VTSKNWLSDNAKASGFNDRKMARGAIHTFLLLFPALKVISFPINIGIIRVIFYFMDNPIHQRWKNQIKCNIKVIE
jgi:hypothetical protein